MKEIDLSSMISLAKKVFDIIEKEYFMYLTKEKKNLIKKLDYNNFFKTLKRIDTPPIFLNGDTYYLKENDLENIINNQELIIIMCLIYLCGEINPLKLSLIKKEAKQIGDKLGLKSNLTNQQELELANIIKEKLLNTPVNIIFIDSNIEIFNYLTEEKDINIAKLYYELSKLMQLKYKNFDFNNYNLKDFFNYYNNINYDDALDLVYNFINQKINSL